jgi:hypothetical protein
MRLDWLRSEIGRMRQQLRAQEREIRMLRRAGVPTASAELLLVRMRAKIDEPLPPAGCAPEGREQGWIANETRM